MEHSHLAVAMMNTVAIDCNNLGVDFLQGGHPNKAVEAFREAAKLIQPISAGAAIHLEAARKESIPAASPSDAFLRVVFKLKERVNLLLATQRCTPSSTPEKVDYDRSSMMFTAPMKISNLNCGPESYTILVAATLLYNVALTFHLNGTEKSLRKSARLFEKAYATSLLAYAEDGSNRHLLEKLCMASLNNSGHIHHKLGNYQAAKHHLASLFDFMLSLPVSLLSSEDKSERQAVLLNVLLLQEPSIAAAA